MTHIVRNLTPDDIDRAVEIIEETNPEPTLTELGAVFRKTITLSFQPGLEDMAPTFVGVDVDGKLQSVAGYVWSAFSAQVWEFCWGSVAAAHQGKGIGDAMVKFRLSEIPKRTSIPGTAVIVHTLPTSLYLNNGFEKITPVGTIGKWVLSKSLS